MIILYGFNYIIQENNQCPLCKSRFQEIITHKKIKDKDQEPNYTINNGDLLHFQDMTCQNCGSGTDDHLLLLCDGCNDGYHTYCVGLADIVPDERFFCDKCNSNGTSDAINQEFIDEQKSLLDTYSNSNSNTQRSNNNNNSLNNNNCNNNKNCNHSKSPIKKDNRIMTRSRSRAQKLKNINESKNDTSDSSSNTDSSVDTSDISSENDSYIDEDSDINNDIDDEPYKPTTKYINQNNNKKRIMTRSKSREIKKKLDNQRKRGGNSLIKLINTNTKKRKYNNIIYSSNHKKRKICNHKIGRSSLAQLFDKKK